MFSMSQIRFKYDNECDNEKDLDKFQENSVSTTGWFNLDHE